MTVFSVTDAAFEGFRLTWEKPRTLLIWTGFFLVVNLIVPLAIFGFGLAPRMEELDAVLASRSQDPQAEIAIMIGLWPVYAILLPTALLVLAAISAAVFRLVLDPEESRLHPVQFGWEEARLIALFLSYFLLFFVVVLTVVFIGGIIAALAAIAAEVVGLSFATPLIGKAIGLALCGGLIYVAVRMSLGPVVSFSEGRIAIFASWAMSKGLFWPMLSAYALATLSVATFYILCSVLAAALGAIMLGGNLAAVGQLTRPDMSSFGAFFSPVRVLMLVFWAFTLAVFYPVMSAPAAVIYREIRARRSTV